MTAIMSIRAVVVMVRVMRGQGLLAIITDDLSSHIQEVDALLLQCCRQTQIQDGTKGWHATGLHSQEQKTPHALQGSKHLKHRSNTTCSFKS